MIYEYAQGDMTSVVYPVGGGLEDWAYGAGWDHGPDAAVPRCSPRTYPLPDNFYAESTDHIATTVFLIEMDDSKDPPEDSYGAREVVNDNEYTRVDLPSILSSNNKFNGHMNRNIRAMLALVDNAKPYFSMIGIERNQKDEVEVSF